jgi:SAM-dependent MidA family methyltransferase
LVPGDRFEVCPAAGEVIEQMGHLLQTGFVLTIDYGNKAPDVHKHYAGRMDEGVRAYYKQRPSTPFERVGEQDLTADIDFSLLVRRGQNAGLQEVGFTNQLHLLGGNGFLDKVKQLDARVKQRDFSADFELQSMIRLFLPHMLGEMFKVLVQVKGIEAEPLGHALSLFRFDVDQML